LIGFAGDLTTISTIVSKLRKNPTGVFTVKSQNDLNGIMVKPDGHVMVLESGGWFGSDAKYYAIGSGRVPAMVAMRCGKSAAEAVKIAMDFDPITGGKVQSVRLNKRSK